MLRDVAGGGKINSQKTVLTFSGIILNDEWEYVEQTYSEGVISAEDMAKELISIYMVA